MNASLATAGPKRVAKLDAIQQQYANLVSAQKGWQTGNYQVIGSANKLTETVRKQELTFRELYRTADAGSKTGLSRLKANYRAAAAQIAQEQVRLKQSVLTTWKSDALGQKTATMATPDHIIRGGNTELLKRNSLLSSQSAILQSVSNNTIKWGKNMQWSGRQLSLGISLPIVAAAAAMAKFAYTADQAMTRLLKVYGDGSQVTSAEMKNVENATRNTAKEVAKSFGIAADATIDMAAEFASAGYQGAALQTMVKQTSRASMLGELDRQDAIKTTISLQTVFKVSSQELAATFDKMNAVENGTILTMKDMTQAIPRAAQPIASMGGSVNDLLIALTAMRAGGIDASIGANALRSSLAAIVGASPTIKKRLLEIGIDLDQVVKKNQGNVLGMFEDIGVQVKKQAPELRQGIYAQLFGRFQFGRAQTLIEGLVGVSDDPKVQSQVENVKKIVQNSASENAAIALKEQKQLEQSVSGRIKRTVESIKAQFMTMGRPALEFAAVILSAFSKVVSFINKIPGAKLFLEITLGLLAVIGPLVMITGLMGNLFGQIAKGIIFFKGWGKNLGIVTAQEQASELALRTNTSAIQQQTASYADLMFAIDGVSAALARESALQNRSAAAAMRKSGVKAGDPKYGQMPGNRTLLPIVAAPNAAPLEKSAGAMARFGSLASRAAIPVATIAILTQTISGNSSGIMAKTANWALTLSLVAPIIAMIARRFGILGKASTGLSWIKSLGGKGATGAANSTGALAKTMGSLGKYLPIAARGLGIVGIGLGALQIGISLYNKHMAKVEESQRRAAQGAQDMASVIGASWKQAEASVGNSSSKITFNIDNMQSKADDWKKKSKDAFKQLASIDPDKQSGTLKTRIAQITTQGLLSGWTPAQAAEAAKVMYTALASELEGAAKDRMLHLAAKVDITDYTFKDNKEVLKKAIDLQQERIKKNLEAAPVTFSMNVQMATNQANIKDVPVSFSEMSDKALKNLKDSGRQAGEELKTIIATQGGAAGTVFFNSIKDRFDDVKTGLLGILKLSASDTTALHGDYKDAAGKILKLDTNNLNQMSSQLGKMSEESFANLLARIDSPETKRIFTDLRANAKSGHAVADGLIKAATGSKLLYGESGTLTTAQLQLAAAFEQVGFGASDAEIKLAGLAGQVKTFDTTEFVSAAQSQISSQTDKAASVIYDAFDKQTQAGQDALNKQEKAENDALDKSKKNKDSAKDKELKRIDEIKKKNDDAEKARQAMFEAELTRQRRLAENANRANDLNVALASGNLDEAARVMGDSTAASIQNAIEDAQKASDLAMERSNNALDKKKALLEEEKKAEDDALTQKKERIREEYEARRKSYDRRRELSKEALTKEIEYTKQLVPQSKQQWATMLKNMEGILAKQSGSVKFRSEEWAALVGTGFSDGVKAAGRELMNKEMWARVGDTIASGILDGAFGVKDMNMQDFAAYIATGNLPKTAHDGTVIHNTASGSGGTKVYSHHTGGPIRGTGGAGLRSDETPAILQHGEYVIRKDSVKRYGENFFEGLNQGAPKFHSGGPVKGPVAAAMGAVALTAQKLKSAISTGIIDSVIKNNSKITNQGRPGIFGGSGSSGQDVSTALEKFLEGLRQVESGGNYSAQNKISTASGAYQYLDGTWNSFGGFRRAFMAPREVQDARARQEVVSNFSKYGDWAKVAAAHMYPAWANDTTKWSQSPAPGNPTLADYVNKVLTAAGITSAATFSRGGTWPPVVPGKISGNTQSAKSWISSIWKNTHGGDASLGRSDPTSDHGKGKALDIFPGTSLGQPAEGISLAEGWQIANSLMQNSGRFGTKYLIWQGKINSGKGWDTYNRYGPDPGTTRGHYDHVHASFLHSGGLAGRDGIRVPGLAVGGRVKFDNTLANLHRNETVLTAPLSQQLQDGIKQLDSGSKVEYHISVNVEGTNSSADDIARAVELRMRRRESAIGISRRVN